MLTSGDWWKINKEITKQDEVACFVKDDQLLIKNSQSILNDYQEIQTQFGNKMQQELSTFKASLPQPTIPTEDELATTYKNAEILQAQKKANEAKANAEEAARRAEAEKNAALESARKKAEKECEDKTQALKKSLLDTQDEEAKTYGEMLNDAQNEFKQLQKDLELTPKPMSSEQITSRQTNSLNTTSPVQQQRPKIDLVKQARKVRESACKAVDTHLAQEAAKQKEKEAQTLLKQSTKITASKQNEVIEPSIPTAQEEQPLSIPDLVAQCIDKATAKIQEERASTQQESVLPEIISVESAQQVVASATPQPVILTEENEQVVAPEQAKTEAAAQECKEQVTSSQSPAAASKPLSKKAQKAIKAAEEAAALQAEVAARTEKLKNGEETSINPEETKKDKYHNGTYHGTLDLRKATSHPLKSDKPQTRHFATQKEFEEFCDVKIDQL
jgi:hypothetical protein